MVNRRSLFSFLPLGVLFQAGGKAQSTKINAGTQIKNIPGSVSDNWISIVPAGVIDGVNFTFTLPAGVVARKVAVFLNGLRMAQQTESPANFDFTASMPTVSNNPDILIVDYTL